MKKKNVAALLCLSVALWGNSQDIDIDHVVEAPSPTNNLKTDSCWTYERDQSNWTSNRNSLNCGSPLPGSGADITIGNGRVNFNTLPGKSEVRLHKQLFGVYNNSFNIDFTFNITDTKMPPAFHPVVLTDRNINPSMINHSQNSSACVWPAFDAIGVVVVSPMGEHYDLKILPMTHDDVNGAVNYSTGPSISISYATTYYGRIVINSNEQGELILFNDPNRQNEIDRVCFSVPSTILGLNRLQHANASEGGTGRLSGGWVDDVCIYRNDITLEDCCPFKIEGDDVVCYSPELSTYNYTINATGLNITISPAGLFPTITEVGDQTIVSFSHFGNLGNGPNLVTIYAEKNCGCYHFSSVKHITVYDEAANYENQFEYDLDYSVPNYVGVTQFIPVNSDPDCTHTWEIWDALINSARCEIDPSATGPLYSGTSTGGAPHVLNSPFYIPEGQRFALVHKIDCTNGECAPGEYKRCETANRFAPNDGDPTKSPTQNTGTDTKKVELYPNPVMDKLTIKASEQIQNYSITNSAGQEIISGSSRTNVEEISIKELMPGTYFIQIRTNTFKKTLTFVKK